MAKKVQAMVKLQIAAGKATPAPPVGTALGPQGVNIMDFCKNFNAKTAKDEGLIIPVVVTVYADRSYTFITKTPPAPVLLKRAANIAKGSAEPNKTKVGTVTAKQVEEIAKLKMPDLNCESLEAAVKTVAGTARSMGLDVIGRRTKTFRRSIALRSARLQNSSLNVRAVLKRGRAHGARWHHRRSNAQDTARNSRPPARRSPPIGPTRSKKRSRSCRK